MKPFNLRLFLLNHSPAYAWKKWPTVVREHFPAPNPILLQAECFVADPKRRGYRFELIEAGPGGEVVKRHRADVVILQAWGLMILVRLGAGVGRAARFTGLRDAVIVSAEYVARRANA